MAAAAVINTITYIEKTVKIFMKIIMYKWKAYNHYDLKRSLEKRGHQVDEISGEMANFEEDEDFTKRFEKALSQGKYNLAMSVNYFPLISDACRKYGICYISWCCDSPISTMCNDSIFNDVNKVFTFDKVNQMEFEEMGAPVYYLPLCGAPDRAERVIAGADDLESYDAQVSFVGSMYNKNSYDEVYEHFPDYMKGYFDAAIKLQTSVYGQNLLQEVLDGEMLAQLERYFVIAKSPRSFSDLSLIFSTTVLSYKIAQLERLSLIAEMSKRFPTDVYTDDEREFVLARNKGLADYWNEAPKIFNRSRINLNLTLRSIRSGIPLRVWDIMASGGFCITNYQPEIPLYFEEDKDIVIFRSKEELFDKTAYYLSHEEERAAIALSGYNKVRKYHDYDSRIDEMARYADGL